MRSAKNEGRVGIRWGNTVIFSIFFIIKLIYHHRNFRNFLVNFIKQYCNDESEDDELLNSLHVVTYLILNLVYSNFKYQKSNSN